MLVKYSFNSIKKRHDWSETKLIFRCTDEMTKKTLVKEGAMKIKILHIFHENTTNFWSLLTCLWGLPNRCHDYTSLHILVNLCLVLNIDIKWLFVLWMAFLWYTMSPKLQLKPFFNTRTLYQISTGIWNWDSFATSMR